MKMPQWMRRKTPLILLAEQKAEAERDLVMCEARLEEHVSYRDMLVSRIARISNRIKAMNDDKDNHEQ